MREAVVATINAGTTLRAWRAREGRRLLRHLRVGGAPDRLAGRCSAEPPSSARSLSAHGRLEEAHQLLVEAHQALAPTPLASTAPTPATSWRWCACGWRAVEAIDPMAEAIRMTRDAGAVDPLALS